MAADRYVREGATGANNGIDWTNAYTSLPTNLTRGDTYYVADGRYNGRTFADNSSGATLITIKKCTPGDHGTNAGYNSTYCDGQAAVDGTWAFTRPYYVIDGATRNESNWKDHAAYGFSVTGGFRASRLDGGHVGGDCSADNITIRYVHVGQTTTSYATRGGEFYIAGFGSGTVTCENWTISRVLVQNANIGIQCAGCSGLLVERSYFYVGWAKEAIRGQLAAPDMTVRWSIFEDSCQKDPNDSTSGCTAEIASWGEPGAGNYDNYNIYGNVFFKTTNEHNSGGVVVVGGNGISWLGPPANNARIYNNTVAGYRQGTVMILVNGGSNNDCKNNAWYDISAGVGSGASCSTTSNNTTFSGTPFVNYSGGDFRLTGATIVGAILGAPYNIDILGNTRGEDGTWDIGAFEFRAGGTPTTLSPPTNLTLY